MYIYIYIIIIIIIISSGRLSEPGRNPLSARTPRPAEPTTPQASHAPRRMSR